MKTLIAPGGRERLLAPTTTVKVAKRMLEGSRLAAAKLPDGFYASPALDMMLALFVAEDQAQYLSEDQLGVQGSMSALTTRRWVQVLVRAGLIEQKDDLLALTELGYTTVSGLAESMFDLQRSLD